MDPAAILARSSLFEGFTETGLSILASVAQMRAVPARSPVFVEGTPSESLVVIGKGRVRIEVRGFDGQEASLATLGEGQHLGELALLTTGARRLVSAVAETDTIVVEIRHRDFARLQAQKPQACLKLLMAIAGELGKKLEGNREILGSLLSGSVRR